MQKQNVIVIIQPTIPETTTASRMATGPRIAASWVSSDILCIILVIGWQLGKWCLSYCCKRLGSRFKTREGNTFSLTVVIGHCPGHREETESLSSRVPPKWVTKTYPSRNENPLLPQPEPSVTCVKTHVAVCFSGVRINNAMQMLIDARTSSPLIVIEYHTGDAHY